MSTRRCGSHLFLTKLVIATILVSRSASSEASSTSFAEMAAVFTFSPSVFIEQQAKNIGAQQPSRTWYNGFVTYTSTVVNCPIGEGWDIELWWKTIFSETRLRALVCLFSHKGRCNSKVSYGRYYTPYTYLEGIIEAQIDEKDFSKSYFSKHAVKNRSEYHNIP